MSNVIDLSSFSKTQKTLHISGQVRVVSVVGRVTLRLLEGLGAREQGNGRGHPDKAGAPAHRARQRVALVGRVALLVAFRRPLTSLRFRLHRLLRLGKHLLRL